MIDDIYAVLRALDDALIAPRMTTQLNPILMRRLPRRNHDIIRNRLILCPEMLPDLLLTTHRQVDLIDPLTLDKHVPSISVLPSRVDDVDVEKTGDVVFLALGRSNLDVSRLDPRIRLGPHHIKDIIDLGASRDGDLGSRDA